jgi:Flp pilus assembly protein TadG
VTPRCDLHERGRCDLHERGAAAVEFAFVLPLLMLLVVGIIDFSRIFNAEIQLSQAAREGVRLAALASPVTGYDKAAVRDRAVLAAPRPAFYADPVSVADADIALCSPSSGLNDVASVKATYTFKGIFFFRTGKELSQTAVMRCAG